MAKRRILSLQERVAIFNRIQGRIQVANDTGDHYYKSLRDTDYTIADELDADGSVKGCQHHHVQTVRSQLYSGKLLTVKSKTKDEEIADLKGRVDYLEKVVANLHKELGVCMSGDPLFMTADKWLNK